MEIVIFMRKQTVLVFTLIFLTFTTTVELNAQTQKAPKFPIGEAKPIAPAVHTGVDMTSRNFKIEAKENCEAELKYALLDPNKYVDAKIKRIELLTVGLPLAYWETAALSEILRQGKVDDQRVSALAKMTIHVTENLIENIKAEDRDTKSFGPLHTMHDFTYVVVDYFKREFFLIGNEKENDGSQREFAFAKNRDEVDIAQLAQILTGISVGYGECALNIDGDADITAPREFTGYEGNNKGLKAIFDLAGRIEDKQAMEALAYIAAAEMKRNKVSGVEKVDTRNMESITMLETLTSFDPLYDGTNKLCVIDYERGKREIVEQKQALAVAYLGILGQDDFLKRYLSSTENRTGANVAAHFLGQELPYPYRALSLAVGNILMDVHDFGLMTLFPEVNGLEVPFSASNTAGDGWAMGKLVNNPGTDVVQFSEVSGPSYSINPGADGVATATLTIPEMTNAIPLVSSQWWAIPAKLKSIQTLTSLFYIIRVLPTIALMVDKSGTYSIDANNKLVSLLNENPVIDATKSSVSITVTFRNGETIKYIIWVANVAEAQRILNYVNGILSKNPGVFNVDIKSDVKDGNKPVTKHSPSTTLDAKMESRITSALKNSNLSLAKQSEFLNAFKSRMSLASPKITTTFADGNVIYSNVEVSTNSAGITILKITRSFMTANGLVNFVRTFEVAADGKVKEKAEGNDGTSSLPLTVDDAEGLETEISTYSDFCKETAPLN